MPTPRIASGSTLLFAAALLGPLHASGQTPERPAVAEGWLQRSTGKLHLMYVLLPVTVHGHAATTLADLGTGDGLWPARQLLDQLNTPLGKGVEYLDSLSIGSVVEHRVPVDDENFPTEMAGRLSSPGKPMIGLLGTEVLSQYDYVFDGRTGRVHVYAFSPTATTWLPSGITPADCTPIKTDPDGAKRVFFDLQVNGKSVQSMFDSGSEATNANMAVARLLGLTSKSPNVTPSTSGGMLGDQKPIWDVRGLHLTVGTGHIPMTDNPIKIYKDLPRELNENDPELSFGLSGFHDRIFYVSYSTKRVCFGKPH